MANRPIKGNASKLKPKVITKDHTSKIKRWNSQVQFKRHMDAGDAQKAIRNPFLINPRYGHYETFVMSMTRAIECYKASSVGSSSVHLVLNDIKKPAPARVLSDAAKISNLVHRIIPSLNSMDRISLGKTGFVCDVGRLATGHPEHMLKKTASLRKSAAKRGSKGFRVIICTDHYSGGSSQGSAIMALNYVVSKLMPCEIYIQQGWLGSAFSPGKGRQGTVNLIAVPPNLDPSLLWFWCNSLYKDAEFSGAISQKYLKSGRSGVSSGPEIPCDVYTQSDHFDNLKKILLEKKIEPTQINLAAFWISFIISEKFMMKEPLDNTEIIGYIQQCQGQ